MAPSIGPNATALNLSTTQALAHINNATRALSGLLNTTSPHNLTQSAHPPVSHALSHAFTTGIQIVQTIALGVLLVLSAITLFHCREQAKKHAVSKNGAGDEKIAELTAKVVELKGRLVEVADAVERVEEAVRERGEKRVGTPIWEAEILKRIKGI